MNDKLTVDVGQGSDVEAEAEAIAESSIKLITASTGNADISDWKGQW